MPEKGSRQASLEYSQKYEIPISRELNEKDVVRYVTAAAKEHGPKECVRLTKTHSEDFYQKIDVEWIGEDNNYNLHVMYCPDNGNGVVEAEGNLPIENMSSIVGAIKYINDAESLGSYA